jgi:hypothetical protein
MFAQLSKLEANYRPDKEDLLISLTSFQSCSIFEQNLTIFSKN